MAINTISIHFFMSKRVAFLPPFGSTGTTRVPRHDRSFPPGSGTCSGLGRALIVRDLVGRGSKAVQGCRLQVDSRFAPEPKNAAHENMSHYFASFR